MAVSAQQKPPLLHSPGLNSGPSPPPATSYASLQVRLPVPDWPVLLVYTSNTSAKKRLRCFTPKVSAQAHHHRSQHLMHARSDIIWPFKWFSQ